jgi:hypothetical protein
VQGSDEEQMHLLVVLSHLAALGYHHEYLLNYPLITIERLIPPSALKAENLAEAQQALAKTVGEEVQPKMCLKCWIIRLGERVSDAVSR